MAITNTKYTGRNYTLAVETSAGSGVYTVCGGVRTKGVTVNNAEVDITDGDDDTWKKLLQGAGVQSLSVSVSGFVTNNAMFAILQNNAFSGTIYNYRLAFSNGDTITVPCLVTNFQPTGEYNGAQQFSATLVGANTPTTAFV